MVWRPTRRQLGGGLAAIAAGAIVAPSIAFGVPRIVVIGGGAGGATVAGRLARLRPKFDVTLIEPHIHYQSCFFSNAYIGGLYGYSSLKHNYRGLEALGVRVVHERASHIDTSRRTVTLATKKRIEYDRLVVAPGIDFKWDAIDGYSEKAAEIMPHAWRGGAQAQTLRRRLEKMEDGATVVIAAPPMPYRCPPGPYERACVIAHYLKTAKPKSKVVVLDAKMTFSKQAAFEEAFARYYKDNLEIHLTNDIDDFSIERVDVTSGEVRTRAGLTVKAAVANIIPAQTAGAIALSSGLADGDWCPIDPVNFSSAKAAHVYVLGDAAIAAEMPKSAYAAQSQGSAVAADIIADLEGDTRPVADYRNTCWSILAPDDAIKIGADYTPGALPGNRTGLVPANAFVSKPGERPEERKTSYEEAFAWYPTMISEMFNKDMQPAEPARSLKSPHG